MDLFLTEKTTDSNDKEDLKKVIENLAKVIKGSGGDPVEFFFGEGLKTVYSISEASSKIALEAALTKAKVTYKEVAAVRIVGATVDEVRMHSVMAEFPSGSSSGNYGSTAPAPTAPGSVAPLEPPR